MPADQLQINVVGASHSEGELKKVAGGYRAIGHAADQAAHSADKVHGSHGASRNRSLSQAFGGGRSGIGGTAMHIGHLGAGFGAALIAMEGMEAINKIQEARTERIVENMRFQSEIAHDIAMTVIKRDEGALAAVRQMTAYDIGRAAAEDQTLSSVHQQVIEYDKLALLKKKATEGVDAAAGFKREKNIDAGPAFAALQEKLIPMRERLEELRIKAEHETKFGRAISVATNFMHLNFDKTYSGDDNARGIYANAKNEFAEQSQKAGAQAIMADTQRANQIQQAMADSADALKDGANMFHAGVSRSQSGLPSN